MPINNYVVCIPSYKRANICNEQTLEMLHNRMTNSVKTLDKSNASAQWKAICENAMFMLSNYNKLTTDAKKCADGVIELLAKQIEDIARQLPINRVSDYLFCIKWSLSLLPPISMRPAPAALSSIRNKQARNQK